MIILVKGFSPMNQLTQRLINRIQEKESFLDIAHLCEDFQTFCDEIKYNAKTFYKYESSLCDKYQQLTGHFPPLSDNSGVE